MSHKCNFRSRIYTCRKSSFKNIDLIDYLYEEKVCVEVFFKDCGKQSVQRSVTFVSSGYYDCWPYRCARVGNTILETSLKVKTIAETEEQTRKEG